MKTVFVGLSGGVDSSVAIFLLKEQGYKVVGVYMKNWTQKIGNYQCPWHEDYLSAKKLAVFLNIEFLVFDFQTEYKQLVVDYMIKEYELGNTPNPDIICNEEIKFNLFLKACLKKGADLIATGHYAKIEAGKLCKARDESKDQTYFLYRIPLEALKKTLFPLGDYLKSEVRQLAKMHHLPTADRPESMGICFVGEVGIEEFLKQYVETSFGDIINDENEIIGSHKGAIFYTIGQRHGLNVGGGLPYYVVDKDIKKNIVYVSRNLNHVKLWSSKLVLKSLHLLDEIILNKDYHIRIRHGGDLVVAKISIIEEDSMILQPQDSLKALASGQSAVIYDGNQVIGGGIIV